MAVKLPRRDWPNVIALLVTETIVPSAKARGLVGNISVHNAGSDYVLVVCFPRTIVNGRMRSARR